MSYSFDTSALIEPWTRRYPPDLFQPIWGWLENLVDQGHVAAIDEVRHELHRQEDELSAWTKSQEKLFVPASADVQTALRDVLIAFPNLADHERDRSGADPWVVAYALSAGRSVVTYETMGKASKPKIPNACAHFGIGCLSLVDVLRQTGYR
ncbi:DUF4411 family protein [Stenotrophomonas maltophilia]|uniref:DUF4411 family protein n=1 Tax=Stenotrophomonas riyadhensis TaxID=2859893 RepID=A0ABT2XEL9_9GAMM|nr:MULTISPECIES: DUF4411 family protein [Stenotrophomonas]MDR6692588.1 hypothetical protein [Stenotrophomonas sp. 1337]ELC7324553.1 DUF4411 family protein [Stenotrophomonas maltophilia]MBH1620300.1 DUF4411 family protein [Stenotrophomonas maltophilia]MCV0324382.1 DUF4411 family protein [Stenotrophomonas sp. CFS3442]OBU60272.1 hypothetical protein A9J40_19895 [Stenotrophomonas maltophilia]